MKKNFLSLAFIFIALTTYSQVTMPDAVKKEYRNIIGIDATGLLQQFFNLNTDSYLAYPYMISYRRVFKSNALRIGFGGNFFNNTETFNDKNEVKDNYTDINVGIGYEHYRYLGERWNFYFGADAIVNYSNHKFHYSSSNSELIETSYKSIAFGVSPLLGLVFELNPRLFLATETNYDIAYKLAERVQIYSPEAGGKSTTKEKGFYTSFHAPVMLNLRFVF
jgi:hypothetical protein